MRSFFLGKAWNQGKAKVWPWPLGRGAQTSQAGRVGGSEVTNHEPSTSNEMGV